MTAVAGLVLAAGQGTRMRSRVPKVLHPLAGRTMISYVLATCVAAELDPLVVVTGDGGEQVEAALGIQPTVRQDPQRGTADALKVGLTRIPDSVGQLVVIMGDVPLLPAAEIVGLVRVRAEADAAIAVLGAELSDPTGYGRIVRTSSGDVAAVVEEADADAAIRSVVEINAGTYCFDLAWLRSAIDGVPLSASGEYYLTDLVRLAVNAGRRVVVVTANDPLTVMGINDRVQLAAAEAALIARLIADHQRAGVTVVDPSTTRIEVGVTIEPDARIEPWTILAGATTVGSGAVVGPGSVVTDGRIGADARVVASWVESAEVGEGARVGPMAHLRAGSVIGPASEVGNFAEVKNTRLGRGVRQHHFSYLGDADVGDAVNVGAGTVTANFDGSTKHRTVIGAGAFLGVDTSLRAPLTVGEGARTGAGSVVIHDVAPGETVVGVPARPITSDPDEHA
jgi:bifunctional UDP-N-acetylglucosamine pyrophosphorylase/glucosamine-1-phosphate N-acetyltransferase